MHAPGLQADVGVVIIFFEDKFFVAFQGIIDGFLIQLLLKFIILGLLKGAGLCGRATPDIQPNARIVESIFLQRMLEPPECIGSLYL